MIYGYGALIVRYLRRLLHLREMLPREEERPPTPRRSDNPQVGLLRRFLFPFHFFLVISLLSSFGKSSRFLSMLRVDDLPRVC